MTVLKSASERERVPNTVRTWKPRSPATQQY
jgi:hypothetical protein